MPRTKQCNVCKAKKQLNEFGNRANTKDGKNPSCKECIKKYAKAYALKKKQNAKGKVKPVIHYKLCKQCGLKKHKDEFGDGQLPNSKASRCLDCAGARRDKYATEKNAGADKTLGDLREFIKENAGITNDRIAIVIKTADGSTYPMTGASFSSVAEMGKESEGAKLILNIDN